MKLDGPESSWLNTNAVVISNKAKKTVLDKFLNCKWIKTISCGPFNNYTLIAPLLHLMHVGIEYVQSPPS